MRNLWIALAAGLTLISCTQAETDTASSGEAGTGEQEAQTEPAAAQVNDEDSPRARAAEAGKTIHGVNPFPSTYAPAPASNFALVNARILDGAGNEFEDATLIVRDGRIDAVGTEVAIPDGLEVRDMDGAWVTTGIIDIHSHLGVYPSPGLDAHGDGNEISGAVTSEVASEHGIWPVDPGFDAARAAGVTTLHILPGSANLFGGRGTTLRNVGSRTVQGMKFPDAPYTLKMACGENPKRVYGYGGGRFPGGAPFSRMGNVAGYRMAWAQAVEYKKSWEDYWANEDEDASPPTRNLELETLMEVLEGRILVQMHCYRADEMVQIIDMAEEFGYRVSAFHHAVEAYKIADYLAENGICAAMWADWWGFKMEAYDGIRENVALVEAAGACAMIHSDNDLNVQRLNQEVAKAWSDGVRLGLDISRGEAWNWLSSRPAKALGIDDQTGSLEEGKRADLVIWSSDPFSTYALAQEVFIDGAKVFDRSDEDYQSVSDFMVGQPAAEEIR